MERPKISIIIPIYNAGKFIDRCFDSILNQTLQDFEIIAVNDASQDTSLEILQKYTSDSRIVLVDKKENEGPMKARESGYKIAKGDFFMFADGDDYMPEDAFEVLYNEIMKRRGDVVIGDIAYCPLRGEQVLYSNALPYGSDKSGIWKALLNKKLRHNLCGRIYNRRLFDEYEYSCYMNQNHGEDMILFYELMNHASGVYCIDYVAYYYCQNVMSSTQKRMSDKALKQYLFAAQWWGDFLLNVGADHEIVNKDALDTASYLLQHNYDVKIVLEKFPNFASLTSWKSIRSYFSIGKTVHLCALLHCCLYRYLIYNLVLIKRMFKI